MYIMHDLLGSSLLTISPGRLVSPGSEIDGEEVFVNPIIFTPARIKG
jgi:hypothetical protein